MNSNENDHEVWFEQLLAKAFAPHTFRSDPPEPANQDLVSKFLNDRLEPGLEAHVTKMISTYRQWHEAYCAEILKMAERTNGPQTD